MDAMVQNISSQYSIIQHSDYDSISNENIYTTKLQFEDNKLSNLNREERKKLEQELLELARQLNKEMESVNTDLMFDYDDSISSLVLTIKQRDSGEVIRQIPTDEAMELMRKMRDVMSIILDTHG